MTEYEINFNYNKAMSQANELRDISKALKSLGDNSLEDCFANISRNWSGTNSENYVKKGRNVKTKITNSSQSITAAANAIETMAKRIYDAEMRALELARQRSYKN